MNSSKYYLLFLSVLLVLASCDPDEKNVPTYGAGIFVANEGNFGSGNGSITYYNPDKNEAVQGLYHSANKDEFPGDVLQSIAFNGPTAYLVLNGSSKIEVVSGSTFVSAGAMVDEDINQPRYMTIIDGKAYVSVWGPYDEFYSLIDSYVLVLDLSTGAILDKIDTDEGVENLLYNGTWLFASNYNYGGSNTVAVIDPQTNEREDQLELSPGPKEMVLDANGKLWVLCTGSYGNNDGKLYCIDTESLEVVDDFDLEVNPDGELGISADKMTLIYSVGTSVFKMGIDDEEAPEDPFFVASDVVYPYGLDVDPDTGDIYICDALSFSAVGKVYIYTSSGELKTSFDTGIGPTEVFFRK